jgi:hypothetical protein
MKLLMMNKLRVHKKMLALFLAGSTLITSTQGLTRSNSEFKPLKLQHEDGKYFTDQEIQKNKEDASVIKIDTSVVSKKDPRILPNWVHVELTSRGGLDSYSPELMDLTQSYIGVTLGDNISQYLSNISEIRKQTTAFSLSVKVSAIPTVLRGFTQDQAEEKIDIAANKTKAEYTNYICTVVFRQVDDWVYSQQITPQQAELFKAQYAELVKNQIGKAVDKYVQPMKNKMNERLDELQEELTFQEVSIRVAHRMFENDNGSLIIFAQLGKDIVDMNFDSKTGLRGSSIFAQMGTRGMSSQSTGKIAIGSELVSNENVKVALEAFFFHGRVPLISGQRGLYNMAQMPDDVYNNHKEFYNIDSFAQKLSVKMPSKLKETEDQFYVSTGSFANLNGLDSKQALGFGGLVRVAPMVSLQVEGAFNRDVLDSALTEAILFDLSDTVKMYVAHEEVKGLKSPYDTQTSISNSIPPAPPIPPTLPSSSGVLPNAVANPKLADMSSVTAGLKILLFKFKEKGLSADLSSNVEYKVIYHSKNLNEQYDVGGGVGAGLEANVRY